MYRHGHFVSIFISTRFFVGNHILSITQKIICSSFFLLDSHIWVALRLMWWPKYDNLARSRSMTLTNACFIFSDILHSNCHYTRSFWCKLFNATIIPIPMTSITKLLPANMIYVPFYPCGMFHKSCRHMALTYMHSWCCTSHTSLAV